MKHSWLFIMMLVAKLLFCAAAIAQDDSGRPGSVAPANPVPTVFRTVTAMPDGVQPIVAPATGPVKRVMDEEIIHPAPVYTCPPEKINSHMISPKYQKYEKASQLRIMISKSYW